VAPNEKNGVVSLLGAKRRWGSQSVACLECGASYAKPTEGGTLRTNPGCPTCGYVGWIAITVLVGIGGTDMPREAES
jgi:hypothetical protein